MGTRRRWACAAGTALLLRGAPVPAAAQGLGIEPLDAVQPSAGFTSPTGSLREQLDRQAPGGGPSYAPGLLVTPVISVDVGATDSPGGIYGSGPNKPGPDAFVVVTPGVQISGETPRVQVNAGYAPSVIKYLNSGSQDSVYQNLYGSARVTLVPDSLYISSSASIYQQSNRTGAITGGGVSTGTGNLTSINRSDTSTSYNFAVTPYVVHRFGGIGSVQAGYSLAYSANGGDNGLFGDNGSGVGTGSGSPQNLLTNREFISFGTGENFGRINSTTTLQATQYSGSGVYSSSRRNIGAEDLAFAVNRQVTLLGRVGYEDIRYGGFPGILVDDLIWRGGIQLAPNADSRITLAYGHADGFDSAFFLATYRLTARLRVDASYSAGLETGLEEAQNSSLLSVFDRAGTTFNQLTGGPISGSTDFYGVDNNLYRLRRFAATATLTYDRDTYALTAAYQKRTAVSVINAQSASLIGTSDSGPFVTVAWEHALTPVLRSSVSASVGVDHISGVAGSRQTDYAAFAGLYYQLSPTVTASARYNFQHNTGNTTSQGSDSALNNGTVNTLLFGISKTF